MSLRALPLASGTPDGGGADRRSRQAVAVSLAFVLLGVGAFGAGALLLLLWAPSITAPGGWEGGRALAVVHVLALGFVSSVSLGVLYHLAPLAFGRRLAVPVAGLAVWGAYAAGVVMLVTGLATLRTGWVAAGAVVVAAGVAGAAAHLAGVAVRTRRRYPPTWYQAAAVVALVVVGGLGVDLAVMLDRGAGTSFLAVLSAKVVLAIGGWLGVLVVGVSYQLVPMFTPTTARARHMVPVLVMLSGGAVMVAVACAASAPAPLRVALALPYAAGALLFGVDVTRFMAARRHTGPDPVTAGQAAGALLFVLGTAAGVTALTGRQPWPQLAVVTALAGWTPMLIAANSVRIVPFIVWQALPRGRRPRTFAPAPAALGWLGTAAAAVAWGATALGMGRSDAVAGRLGGVALTVCAAAVAGVAVTSLRGLRAVSDPASG